jgi:cobalt/nickel transport system permease protein
MIEEQFSSGESLVHGLDPRMKLITAFTYAAVVALSSGFPALLAALAVSLVLIVIARLPMRKVLYRLVVVNGLILFLWIFLPFTYQGEAWFAFGPLQASREGIVFAIQITLKCNAILLALIALVATMPVATLGHAMGRLRVPDILIQLFLFTYRYIHVIFQEYDRLRNAMKARGFVPRTNTHTYRSYAYLMGMLLVRSYDRAERIHKAMLCRGFRGKYHTLSQFSVTRGDVAYLMIMVSVILGMVLIQWKAIR